MATLNPFDLLGDDDSEDPNQLIAKVSIDIASKPAVAPAGGKKGVAQAQPAKVGSAKLPSKPLPPSQAVRETKNDGQRGERGGRGGGRGGGRDRGGRGFIRDSAENEKSFGNSNGFGGGYRAPDDGEAGKDAERRGYGGPRGGFRGGRRGGFNDGDGTEGERPRRVFERRSGTGRGSEFKREGSGRGNWGTPTDEITPEPEESVIEGEKAVGTEKQPGQEDAVDINKDVNENEDEKEPEEKEMTLEEYEKVLEEKRKALLALKPEERKVNLDKELESMQLLSNKKNDEDVFVKLGSEKDKRKDATEKAKKSLTINEFLKPAEGETYYRGGGRGRGRGRGSGSGSGRGRGGNGGNNYNNNFVAPSIQDAAQFPSLGGK